MAAGLIVSRARPTTTVSRPMLPSSASRVAVGSNRCKKGCPVPSAFSASNLNKLLCAGAFSLAQLALACGSSSHDGGSGGGGGAAGGCSTPNFRCFTSACCAPGDTCSPGPDGQGVCAV